MTLQNNEIPLTLQQILSRKPNYPKAIVGSGLLFAGTKMIMYGRYKAYKSMLGLDLAFSLTTGKSWIGFKTPPGGASVLYLQLEIGYELFGSRLRKADAFRDISKHLIQPLSFWTQHWLKVDQPEGLKLVEHYVEELKPDVVIIDPLYKIVTGNLLTVLDMQKLVDALDILIGKFGVSVILISHTRKGMMDMGEWGSDDLIGSFVFSAWADTIIKVERRGGDRLGVKFDVVRHAEEELEEKEVMFNRDTLEFTVIEPVMSTKEVKEASKEGQTS